MNTTHQSASSTLTMEPAAPQGDHGLVSKGNHTNGTGGTAKTQNDVGDANPLRVDGVMIGTVIGYDKNGQPWVDYAVSPDGGPRPAMAACVGLLETGCSVALMFEAGDPWKPIVIGPLRGDQPTTRNRKDTEPPPVEVEKDEETLTLTAKKQIVLRCGKASITLTRSGKIILRGAYLLSRSSGVNWVKGGSVHIN